MNDNGYIFDPKTNKYPYTEYTDQHYLKVQKDNGVVFDENYPYLDKSFGFRFVTGLVRTLLYLIVFPVCCIRLGLKIKGKQNLKANKALIKGGVLSCCNHVHMWDYLGIMCAIKPRISNILVWARNIQGENSALIRHVGGIPIPEKNVKATMAYMKAIEEVMDGGWLHIYPEGSMWEYYQPIRPFKRGVAHLACKYNKPIIPMAYSYRKPGWIRRVIFKQIACFTLNIGEPLLKDESLPYEEQEKDLMIRMHDAVCSLAGIDPKENLYEPIFNNSKRIDYYTTEYGIGYKGSW